MEITLVGIPMVWFRYTAFLHQVHFTDQLSSPNRSIEHNQAVIQIFNKPMKLLDNSQTLAPKMPNKMQSNQPQTAMQIKQKQSMPEGVHDPTRSKSQQNQLQQSQR